MNNIRNFAIIAHVDHGKSTLADRLLELTGSLKGSHEEQFLDRNPISRERGITIKLAPVRMTYKMTNNQSSNSKQIKNSNLKNSQLFGAWNLEFGDSDSGCILNLIDTPGHVDFSYEVDRTLACVEGVVLLVDATQGMQAQTISNAYKALEKNLVIIPVINKIDLPSADVEGTKQQVVDFLGVAEEDVFEISAKTGAGVEKLLQSVINQIPDPDSTSKFFSDVSETPSRSTKNLMSASVQALIFDSYYDSHRGVIAFVRVFAGELKKGFKVNLYAQNVNFQVQEIGIFTPDLHPKGVLASGEIGYVVTNLKNIHQVRVGDTIVDSKRSSSPLPGYKRVNPMVFASVFTTDPNEYLNLKKALEKLYLNDSSLEFAGIYSKALGAGFRIGFLGLLHADVVRERLEREYNLDLIITPPQVEYLPAGRQANSDGEYFEPIVKLLLVTPKVYLGNVIQLTEDYRARFITMDNKNQITLEYEMPMSELISDYFDKLKSASSGYASLDWELLRYEPTEASKLEILLNEDSVEEFSQIVVAQRAVETGHLLTSQLKEIIPRQQYDVKIQAKYKGKIIASERISAFRKDVTAKLYGGDRTRKDKLLKKQKEGKKKLKMIGRVEIPKEAFLKLFRKAS